MAQRQHAVPSIETDGLTQQQPGDHLAQQHQVALVDELDVLTQEADQLTMEPGLGIHGGLVWFRSPTLPWLPAHPNELRSVLLQGFSEMCRVVRSWALARANAWAVRTLPNHLQSKGDEVMA